MAKFEVYPDAKGQYRWRFRADNGKIIADSGESYLKKSDCLDGIALIKREAPAAGIEDKPK